MSSKFIDLSHTIEDGMITYKGLPAPIVCDFLSRERSRTLYAAGTEFQIGKIEMVTRPTFNRPRSRRPTSMALSFATIGAQGKRLMPMPFASMMCVDEPCWCTAGGQFTGAAINISRITHS